MRADYNPASAELEHAHELVRQGKRDEAYRIVTEILALYPGNMPAIALRDRLDSEEYSEAVKKQDARSLEEGDVGMALPYAMLVCGIICAFTAVVLAINPLRVGLTQGFGAPVRMGGNIIGEANFPAHLMLLFPTVLIILAVVCFRSYRRYTRS